MSVHESFPRFQHFQREIFQVSVPRTHSCKFELLVLAKEITSVSDYSCSKVFSYVFAISHIFAIKKTFSR